VSAHGMCAKDEDKGGLTPIDHVTRACFLRGLAMARTQTTARPLC
jgi:hypothetical protein